MPNGLRIGEGRAFENRQSKLSTNVDRSSSVEFTTVSPTIANLMLVAVVILILIVELSTLSSQLYNCLRTLENQNCFCQLTF